VRGELFITSGNGVYEQRVTLNSRSEL